MFAIMMIDEADSGEADVLTRIALASKRYWGYDDAFMERCQSELTVQARDIESNPVFVARDAGRILGFYVLTSVDVTHRELDMLFVEPSSIGEGVGGALMRHAMDCARDDGASTLQIVADPNAATFYEHFGAKRTGTSISASTGRALPAYEVSLR